MHRSMRWSIAFATLIVAVAAFAQATVGLRVRVIDGDGANRPGAVVLLRHDAGRLPQQSATTDARGEVEFPVLAAEGDWTLSVVIDDEPQVTQSVRVVLGRVTPVILQLTDDAEAPPVHAPGGAVDVEAIAARTRFPESFVRDLPIRGRFYQRVLPIAPGVNDPDGSGDPRVHGATSRDFRAVVNGIANTNPATNRFMSFVNSDSIDQIAVIASGASLEFGRAQGGFAEITQKLGGNRFAASGELRYRSSDLDGSDNSTDRTRSVEYRSVQPSVMISGPVVKDKLWYRLAWERVDQENPVDTLNGMEVQGRNQTIQAYQLTWQASPRNRLALQYQSDPLSISGFGIDSLTPYNSSQRVEIDGDALSLNWTVPWSSRLLLDTTVALQERSTTFAPQTESINNQCVVGEPFEDAPCNTNTGILTGSQSRTADTSTDRWSVATRGTWHVGSLAGSAHTIRFGAEIEGNTVEQALRRNARSDRFVIERVGDPDAYFQPPVPLLPTEYALEVDQVADIASTLWGVYIEDRFRLRRNMVVEFGVRLDREELDLAGMTPFDPRAEADSFARRLEQGVMTPNEIARSTFTGHQNLDAWMASVSEQSGLPESELLLALPDLLRSSVSWNPERQPASVSIRNTNVSPRFALSWDPWNNGRNKFSGSARRYYGMLLPAAALITQNTETFQMMYELDYRSYRMVGPSAPFGGGVISTASLDDQVTTPYQDEWRLAYDRQIGPSNRLRVEYVNRTYRDQLQLEETNRATGDFGRCAGQWYFQASPVPSPGSGFELTDPGTNETYIDTDPGDGDGRIDDCVGVTYVGLSAAVLPHPDGIPDLYVQNPAWGSVQRLSSTGRRDYEAVVVDFVRRRFRGWGMQASYVWSQFEGSSEPYDLDIGIDRTRLENRRGVESTDQRHVVKVAVNGATSNDWRFGGVVTWGSGLPYSQVNYRLDWLAISPAYRELGMIGTAIPRYGYGTDERNSERNGSSLRVDARVAKGFSIGDRSRVELALDIFNLLDRRDIRHYNPDTEMGLVVNRRAAGRRDIGRSFQLGFRVTY